MKARAVVHAAVDRAEVRDFECRDPREGEVVVRTAYSCVSPGTELRCLRGKQENLPPHPYVAGYATAGRVIAAGRGAALREGDAVFVAGATDTGQLNRQWGGHVSHALTPADRCVPVPAGVDLLDASLAKLAAIALHGVNLARATASDRVVVVGLGVLGQLSARLHAGRAAAVVGVDVSPWRIERVREAGVEGVGSVAAARERHAEGFDLVVDATGAPAVLAEAVELATATPWGDTSGKHPRYLVQGSYEREFAVPYQKAFKRELAFLLTRDHGMTDLRDALSLMAAGKLRARELITRSARPEEADDVYRALRTPSEPVLTVAFDWRE